MVSEYDALQAEVRVENIKPTVQQIKNDLKNAKNGLKIILGIDQNEDIDVEGEFVYEKESLPEEFETIQAALESNYSISSLKYKMQVDEAFIALDRAEYWPSLYAFGNYTYAGSSDNWNFQNYSSSIIGVTFSMNLFNGNRTKNKVQQSEISLKQTGQQLSQLNDFISSKVKAKLNELIRVQTTLDAQERNVTLAEKAYKISTVRYQEGTGSQLEVENADIALKQARINRLQSIYDYIIAKSSLNELLGKVESKYFELLKLKK